MISEGTPDNQERNLQTICEEYKTRVLLVRLPIESQETS